MYKKSIVFVLFFAIIMMGFTPSRIEASDSSSLQQNMAIEIEYISNLQMSSGVIRNSTEYGSYDKGKFYLVQPYNANIAALALLKDPSKLDQVKHYIEWYFNHINWPDTSGIYGTVYDYWIDDQAQEKTVIDKKTGKPGYDSVDSYSATFLMLVKAFYDAGGENEKAFIKDNKYKIDVIGNTITDLIDPKDNLTWAKPGYPVKYLMDNSEAYKGLCDLADLFNKLGDSEGSAWYRIYADRIKAAINSKKGLADGNWYYPAKLSNGSRTYKILYPLNAVRNHWYPDISAQFYPILYGVLSPTDPKAVKIYQTLSNNYNWQNLKVCEFPFVQIGYVGALMNDPSSVRNLYHSVSEKYLTQYSLHKSTWNSWEAGWYVLMVDKMLDEQWKD